MTAAVNKLWVKICGNTSLGDAQLAVDAGADALGFIFAPSPRRVTAEQVAAITRDLRGPVETLGVFVDTDFEQIAAAVEQCALTGVQLHSAANDDLPRRLRERFGAELRILRVIHFGVGAADHLQALREDKQLDGVLVDSRTATAVGGTGVAFDWQAARDSLFTAESGLKLIAAGGLSPANVAEAIHTMRPWGVDVVSGVEAAPGVKDAAKVAAFVANACAASATLL